MPKFPLFSKIGQVLSPEEAEIARDIARSEGQMGKSVLNDATQEKWIPQTDYLTPEEASVQKASESAFNPDTGEKSALNSAATFLDNPPVESPKTPEIRTKLSAGPDLDSEIPVSQPVDSKDIAAGLAGLGVLGGGAAAAGSLMGGDQAYGTGGDSLFGTNTPVSDIDKQKNLLAKYKELSGLNNPQVQKQPGSGPELQSSPKIDENSDVENPADSVPTQPKNSETIKNLVGLLKNPSQSSVKFPNNLDADYSQKLKEAQEQRDLLTFTNMAGKGAELIGSGIVGATGNGLKPTDLKGQTLFDENIKNAALGIQDLKDKMEFDKHDPNSAISQNSRQFLQDSLKAAGMKLTLPNSLSAAQIKDQFPTIEKMLQAKQHNDSVAVQREYLNHLKDINRQDRLDKDTTKRFDDLGKKLTAEVASSRTTFGTDAKTLQATQNLRALFQGRDLNDLDQREVYETARVLDRILSQGAPTQASSGKLTPETARGWLGKQLEFVSNTRQGAGAGSFLQNISKTLDREDATATKRIISTQGKLLSSYSDLKKKDPVKWEQVMNQFNLPSNILDKKSEVDSQEKSIMEAKKWLLENPNDPNRSNVINRLKAMGAF